MNNSVVIAILISLLVNELLGFTDWLADRIVRRAARRWSNRTGHDHLDDWRDDLAHSPGRLFKLVTASWLLLGTIVGPERLTLNLPSLWRLSRPLRALAHTAGKNLEAVSRRQLRRTVPSQPSRRHQLVIKAAARMLPRHHRTRYAEEWSAELYAMPRRARAMWSWSIALGAPSFAFTLRRQGRDPH